MFFVNLLKGGTNMSRTAGRKNVMRTPGEKKKIVLEASKYGPSITAQKYSVHMRTIYEWTRKYKEGGIEALKNKSGNNAVGRYMVPKTKEDELRVENLKLKIEVARLKKGYQVKGVGAQKEFVTIKSSNMK